MTEEIFEFIKIIPEDAQAPGNPSTCKACKHEFKIPMEMRDRWIELKKPCPKCGETFHDRKNQTERDLLRMQDKYFIETSERKKDRILYEMHTLMVPYFMSILRDSPTISKQLYQRIVTEPDFCEEKAYDASLYIIEQYKKRNDFKMHTSFSGYAYNGGFNSVLFDKKYWDIIGNNRDGSNDNDGKNKDNKSQVKEVVSINVMFDDEKGNGAPVYPVGEEDEILKRIEQAEDLNYLIEEITNLVERIKAYTNDPYEDLIRLMAVTNHISKQSSVYADKWFRVNGRYGKEMYLKTMELIKNRLQNNNH